MQLNEMSTTRIQNMLLAVQELKAAYSSERRKKRLSCPLCDYVSGDDSIQGCKICPWLVFEGFGCMSGPLGIRTEYYKSQRISARLVRVARWETLIVEELAVRRIA